MKMTFAKKLMMAVVVAPSLFAAGAEDMKGSPDVSYRDPVVPAAELAARPKQHGVRPIQRTLRMLEESTAERPARVRVLFYGQSIVGQRWHPMVIDELKRRYPTAILEVRNCAIGGFDSSSLVRTAESDLYPYYPDLLFFHVYGPMGLYEEIVRKVRETTTAEIVLWTSHLTQKDSSTRAKIESAAATWDARSLTIARVAARYGCLFVDLRTKWSRMMLKHGYAPEDVLSDSIHMKTGGPGFPKYAEFIYEELLRESGADGDPAYCGTIEEIPLTDSRVRKGGDGSLELAFDGNRVIAIADGEGRGRCGVTLDGRVPESFPEMFYSTRPSFLVSWMPMVKHVDSAPGVLPVAEDWTLTYIEGTMPRGNPIHYRVDGTVTGFDGEGWNTNDFRSASGRAMIAKSDFHTWQYDYFKPTGGKDSKPGQKITWSVRPLFANPFVPGRCGERQTLVQNCANARHVLRIRPESGGKCGVSAFIVYRPARTNH